MPSSIIKSIRSSFVLVLVIAVLATICGSVAKQRFSLAYVFTANFIVGAFIILVGLTTGFLPFTLAKSSLIDHTTYVMRKMEEKAAKRAKASEYMSLGMGIVFIAGVIQLLLSFL